ncbi:endolytic transglycosylase MltG [Jeotgalibacillus marinus]|uniref:Endolytic murein transglycosylase n=1 Tax=Jeotgalibacillus marinus TaxID=86667 RepID=A0ABV3PZJ8_9BACL
MNENRSRFEQWIHNLQERKKEAKLVRKIVFVSMMVVVFLFIGISVGGYWYISSALKPVDAKNDTPVTVEIPVGSSVDSITSTLAEHDIVKDARVFKYYLKFNNESDFQAGIYELTQSMTLEEITESLKSGKAYHEPLFSITIPEGLRLEKIGELVADKTDYTEEQFMETVSDADFIASLQQTYPELITDEVVQENVRYPLEGYLFPKTYPFYEENPSLQDMISQMVDEMNNEVTPFLDSMKELNVHEVLTFASLLEVEATASTDRRMIAGVFYNRLEEEMPLQTDPTVLYALGEWKDRVVYEDLEIDHPYNTYKHTGLPPGPISAPGLESIEATLDPKGSDYLYFLAGAEDGEVYYSESLEEHERKAELYIYSKNEEKADSEE